MSECVRACVWRRAKKDAEKKLLGLFLGKKAETSSGLPVVSAYSRTEMLCKKGKVCSGYSVDWNNLDFGLVSVFCITYTVVREFIYAMLLKLSKKLADSKRKRKALDKKSLQCVMRGIGRE